MFLNHTCLVVFHSCSYYSRNPGLAFGNKHERKVVFIITVTTRVRYLKKQTCRRNFPNTWLLRDKEKGQSRTILKKVSIYFKSKVHYSFQV